VDHVTAIALSSGWNNTSSIPSNFMRNIPLKFSTPIKPNISIVPLKVSSSCKNNDCRRTAVGVMKINQKIQFRKADQGFLEIFIRPCLCNASSVSVNLANRRTVYLQHKVPLVAGRYLLVNSRYSVNLFASLSFNKISFDLALSDWSFGMVSYIRIVAYAIQVENIVMKTF